MEFEEVKARLLEEYGEGNLLEVSVCFLFEAKEEGRAVVEKEMLFMRMCALARTQVEEQMHHLATVCEGPIPNPATMTEEEGRALSDDIAFGGRDEQVAARVNLVKLHKPDPEGVTGEEFDAYLDNKPREVFASFNEITVREAFDYLDYWEQERESTDAMQGFMDEWKGYQEIAEITGDDPPDTLEEYMDYRKRLDKEQEEDEQ